MEGERSHIDSVRGLIIQSREKELLFREHFGLTPEIPALVLPICHRWPSAWGTTARDGRDSEGIVPYLPLQALCAIMMGSLIVCSLALRQRRE
jgi:hypothetical protein